ncbi:MAG: DUF2934 domain-containing protein [Acidobacteriota bacterium]
MNAGNVRHEEIELRAYQLWGERGASEGTPEDDWLRAEQELFATGDPLIQFAREVGSAIGAAVVSLRPTAIE